MPVFEKSKVIYGHQKVIFHQSFDDMYHYGSKKMYFYEKHLLEYSKSFWRALCAHEEKKVSFSKSTPGSRKTAGRRHDFIKHKIDRRKIHHSRCASYVWIKDELFYQIQGGRFFDILLKFTWRATKPKFHMFGSRLPFGCFSDVANLQHCSRFT